MKALKTLENQRDLDAYLLPLKSTGKQVGFVPTMGALHEGHLSLIQKAKAENDIVVCSIFVNPTQFNDPADFERYPRVVSEDTSMLEKAGCDILFLPGVKDIYPDDSYKQQIDFGDLETVLEGKFRPGHFKGVGMVVKRLLELVKPHRAYFGLKDFQQYLIIRKLKEIFSIPVEVIGMPTIRESDGVAMSSRNRLLSAEERKNAAVIPQVLLQTKKHFGEVSIPELKKSAIEKLSEQGKLKPEYFEIADAETLQPVLETKPGRKYIALVAAYNGKIRLIDNMMLN